MTNTKRPPRATSSCVTQLRSNATPSNHTPCGQHRSSDNPSARTSNTVSRGVPRNSRSVTAEKRGLPSR
ncbi:hypothetical protein Tdes44962_MAKER08479 [Teratosphaeria destructans]|uniref:Uncharacterized protein n=1 Tax=Teratosphaeria destructans TaxID=418781 RepID=A0A9W7SX01_9PEZI|nr:hypothetical protein Tdes44962_MAKER08479 [Teratosphaeria destructans]